MNNKKISSVSFIFMLLLATISFGYLLGSEIKTVSAETINFMGGEYTRTSSGWENSGGELVGDQETLIALNNGGVFPQWYIDEMNADIVGSASGTSSQASVPQYYVNEFTGELASLSDYPGDGASIFDDVSTWRSFDSEEVAQSYSNRLVSSLTPASSQGTSTQVPSPGITPLPSAGTIKVDPSALPTIVSSKDQLSPYLSKETIAGLGSDLGMYSGSYISNGNLYGKDGSLISRGTVTVAGMQMQFGIGHIVQGFQWSLAVVAGVKLIAPMLGMDEKETNAISLALGAGILAGKLSYSLLGQGGAGSGTWAPGWASSPVTSGLIGAGVAWITYNALWEKEDVKNRYVDFQCLPWQAPHGGLDCELCNDDTLPCSEYRCKSLGQSCDIVNKGTAKEMCVNINPRDVSPPIITPLDSALSTGLKYTDVKANPPGAGFKIKSTETTTGCIKPYTAIDFGIKTNEPSQCKIDYERRGGYENMSTYFGGSNIYGYNHTESLTLPSAESFANSSLKLENGKILNFYMRCKDGAGNVNEADYTLELCVDPSPDNTAPQIIATSLGDGSCVAADSDNSTVEFYVNEPAECKWSFEDRGFDAMLYNMSCSQSITEINALQLYPCKTTLTGISKDSTKFFVRCKDQPSLAGVNESKRNKNEESFMFSLRGSNPLKMKNLRPNETIFGAVRPTPVELYVETLFGCDNNKAICYYSTQDTEGSYIQFFDTDKDDGIHTQRLDLNDGIHTYNIKCIDSGGNMALNSTTFRLDIDPNAPVIARVYHEEPYLKIVTPREAECAFTNDGCDFLFEEGTKLAAVEGTTHLTPWVVDQTYYIKCRDEFRPETADCSLRIKPTDNFLSQVN